MESNYFRCLELTTNCFNVWRDPKFSLRYLNYALKIVYKKLKPEDCQESQEIFSAMVFIKLPVAYFLLTP